MSDRLVMVRWAFQMVSLVFALSGCSLKSELSFIHEDRIILYGDRTVVEEIIFSPRSELMDFPCEQVWSKGIKQMGTGVKVSQPFYQDRGRQVCGMRTPRIHLQDLFPKDSNTPPLQVSFDSQTGILKMRYDYGKRRRPGFFERLLGSFFSDIEFVLLVEPRTGVICESNDFVRQDGSFILRSKHVESLAWKAALQCSFPVSTD